MKNYETQLEQEAYSLGINQAKISIENSCPVHLEDTLSRGLSKELIAFRTGWNSMAKCTDNIELLKDIGYESPIQLTDSYCEAAAG